MPLSSLDARQQKLMENARVAAQRSDFEYALSATARVLAQAPACVAVRRFRRAVQLRARGEAGAGLLAKVASGISSAPFLFGMGKKSPEEMMTLAEGILEKHPHNVPALKLLATAAQRMGWLETAAFALAAVRELEPDNRANLLELGEVLLAAGRATEALRMADEVLRERPADGAAQDLMRKASIAEAMEKGQWETDETFRGKLRAEPEATANA